MSDDKPKADDKVSIRYKAHARGVAAGTLRRVDKETAKALVENGHAKYVGADKP